MSWFGDFAKNRKEIARLKKENDKLYNELERMKVMYAKLRDNHDNMKKTIKLAITD
jgi:predicted RNase H-like nuclease (RuvC/YqgF family)